MKKKFCKNITHAIEQRGFSVKAEAALQLGSLIVSFLILFSIKQSENRKKGLMLRGNVLHREAL